MKVHLLLLSWFILVGTPRVSGQDIHDFYHIDSTQATPSCVLPALYFTSKRSNSLTGASQEDIRYLVLLLEQHPDMHLRLRSDGAFRRFDRFQTRINRRRLKKLARILTRRYDIDRNRLILVPHEPWDYRSAKDDPVNELVARRVVCDCVWRRSKRKKPESDQEPSGADPAQAPAGELDLLTPINPAEVAGGDQP